MPHNINHSLPLANSIRALAMDAVQKANSGHPGMPMGMADIATVLWREFLQHNPQNPHWLNRDRFILSNGHGSMLQYALLHLTGYDLSIEDLKNFRQLHSKTPGHPEYGITPGVETTTGPLGQGLAHAVGMALAEKMLAAQFNQPDFNIIDHHTYVFLGDGCLMEGISHEACSLAGTWRLNKLIAFWDDNGISIDGHVEGWFTDNTPMRFRSYGWQVIENINGHDPEAIFNAIRDAHKISDKPILICCKTVIGFGAPNKAGSHDVHGAPLGEDEIKAAREKLGWHYAPFEIPQEIYAAWDARESGQALEAAWQILWQQYQQQYPDLSHELKRRLEAILPENFKKAHEAYIEKLLHTENPAPVATRKSSQQYLDEIVPVLPELLGGSADLTGSNLTQAKSAKAITPGNFHGNYIYYGVREFGMSAIMCGLALHGGFIPFGGTFLTFADYARNAVRLAALMKKQVIFVYTHDSIGLGEDGPTHQPIEHLAMLRSTPGLSVWRPCDAVETAVAWQIAITSSQHPTCLLLSRQNLPAQQQQNYRDILRGAYVLRDFMHASPTENKPHLILISTGSEIYLAMEAAKILHEQNHLNIRVVSMPSVDYFLKQEKSYQEYILPASVKKRIAIEAGATGLWHQFVGSEGKIMGIDRFGESAPAEKIYAAFGITVENIVNTAREII